MIASYEGRFSLEQVIFLLKMDWPDKTFDRRTVANAIQKAKAKASHYDGSEAAELFKILQSKAHEDKDWFVATELDSKGRLQRIFWMSPSQRSLYRRYHDVVLNDNTFKTNRFGMPLNVLVIVDNNGKSRLAGCSLVSGETTLDYEWILQKLLEANNNTAPRVILVDEDLAMEAACANVIKSTILLNCIWHLGHQNLNRNLHGALGKDWEAFISSFWVARNAITEQEFEHRWLKDVTVFGAGKPKVQVYLDRIFQRREHWAWPWVGTRFTAGMQSTQRIESVNAAIKRHIHSKTSLPSLFQSIEKVISNETRSSRCLNYRMDTNSDPAQSQFIKQMFSDVIDVNKHYLGLAASSQMKMEMMRSVYYHASLYEPEVAHEYAAEYSVEQLQLANANEEVQYACHCPPFFFVF